MVQARGSFHETKNRKTFLKHPIPDFADRFEISNYLFVF